MHTLWESLVHLLKNFHFSWEIDVGIAVTIVSCVRYLSWKARIHLRHSGADWTPANGRVLSGQVKDLPNLKRWVVILTYSYFVNEFRSGEYSSMFRSEEEAADCLREAKDQEVVVRYHPRRPERSTLDTASVRMLQDKLQRFTLNDPKTDLTFGQMRE